MKNDSKTSEQKENDKSLETKSEVTEIYNLNGRELKIVVIKKLHELEENSESQFKSSEIKVISRRNTSPKRFQL